MLEPRLTRTYLETACGWCNRTHIADISCTCSDPCWRDWCPRKLDAELASSPDPYRL